MKKDIAIAWGAITVPYFVLMASDYLLRTDDGNIRTGGLETTFVVVALAPFFAFALYLLWKSAKAINSLFLRSIFLIAQAAAAFLFVQLIGMWYVLGLGIDSL